MGHLSATHRRCESQAEPPSCSAATMGPPPHLRLGLSSAAEDPPTVRRSPRAAIGQHGRGGFRTCDLSPRQVRPDPRHAGHQPHPGSLLLTGAWVAAGAPHPAGVARSRSRVPAVPVDGRHLRLARCRSAADGRARAPGRRATPPVVAGGYILMYGGAPHTRPACSRTSAPCARRDCRSRARARGRGARVRPGRSRLRCAELSALRRSAPATPPR